MNTAPASLLRCRGRLRHGLAVCAWFVLLPGVMGASVPLSEEQLGRVQFEQKLNAQVPTEVVFRDEQGQSVTLGQCLNGKPALLVMGYYGCPMLCTLAFNGMVEAAQDISWTIGNEFVVIHVSIDPQETTSLAAAKKNAYLKRYGRAGASSGWHFLTGDESSIARVSDAVGFRYAYEESSRQYAHPSGLVVLSRDGKVMKYLLGVTYSSKDLLVALQDANKTKPGSRAQEIALLCFRYNPIKGRYGPVIMGTLRIGAAITVGALALFWIGAIRRRQRDNANGDPAEKPAAEGAVSDPSSSS